MRPWPSFHNFSPSTLARSAVSFRTLQPRQKHATDHACGPCLSCSCSTDQSRHIAPRCPLVTLRGSHGKLTQRPLIGRQHAHTWRRTRTVGKHSDCSLVKSAPPLLQLQLPAGLAPVLPTPIGLLSSPRKPRNHGPSAAPLCSPPGPWRSSAP
jgi:hypothetical protein